MKNLLFTALLAGATVLSASAQTQLAANLPTKTTKKSDKVATYKVQPAASKVEWLGKKVTGQHNGAIQLKEGAAQVKDNQLTGGTFVMDMTTITDADLTDAGYNAKLIGHLKSEDFFSVEKNPTSTFVIKTVAPLKADEKGNNVTVTGDLTIKGITNPVSFPAKVTVSGGTLTATGTAVVNRAKYDIRYGSKSFFASIGDKAIDDDFTLTFNVTAKQ